jgi:hypothetical protein
MTVVCPNTKKDDKNPSKEVAKSMENGAAVVMEHPPNPHNQQKVFETKRTKRKMSRKPKYENNYL